MDSDINASLSSSGFTRLLRYTDSYDEDRDSLTEVIVNVLVGTFLVVFTPAFLWYAERQMVQFEKVIRRCQLATRCVKDIFVVDKFSENRPICVQGKSSTEASAMDSEIGYSPPVCAVRLSRTVEMYQWVEIKNKDVVRYEKEWREMDVDSMGFRESYSHRNPMRTPSLHSKTYNSDAVFIGAYKLNQTQVGMMQKWESCLMSEIPEQFLRSANPPTIHNGCLIFMNSIADNDRSAKHVGNDGDLNMSSFPQIGTVRVKYTLIPTDVRVTTIAVQIHNTFRPFVEADATRITWSSKLTPAAIIPTAVATAVKDGRGMSQKNLKSTNTALELDNENDHPQHTSRDNAADEEEENDCSFLGRLQCCVGCMYCLCCRSCLAVIEPCAKWSIGDGVTLLEEEWVDINAMFRHEWTRYTTRVWLIRAICYVLLGVGLYFLLFSPLVYLLSFLPYVGWLAGHVLFLASLVIGLLEGLLITTVASVLHRPILLAVYLLAIGAACWIGATSAGAVLAGKCFCASAVIPIGLSLYQCWEECQFRAAQRALDDQQIFREDSNKNNENNVASISETTPLV